MGWLLAAWLLLVTPIVPAWAGSADPPGAVFVTLGTGAGPAPRANRSGPANAVVVGDDVYLFDAGPGTLRQLAAAGLANRRLKAVFLSHHHIDHVGDLAPLLGTRWMLNQRATLLVYGPPGTAKLVSGTLAALAVLETVPVTIGRAADEKPVAASAVGHDQPTASDPLLVYADADVKVYAIDVARFHAPGSGHGGQPRSLAFRIEARGRVFTYTGDTGPTDRLARLAAGSDVLVSEVIDIDRTRAMLARTPQGDSDRTDAIMAHMQSDHLVPEEIARIANAAGVRAVVLTHLEPGLDGEKELARFQRRRFADLFPAR